MKLKEVFKLASNGKIPNEFLYLPADEKWSLDTVGTFIEWTDEDLDSGDDLPLEAKKENLQEALDGQTIQSIVEWADRLSGKNDDARLEVFFYYYDYDAFPEKLGGPPPPPADEILTQLDQEFYDQLGEERVDKPCKTEGCSRGSVQYSVFCRIHHFESIKKKPCPFTN